MSGSFAKLAAWNYSLAIHRRVIVLDVDMILLRNIDHLAEVPLPDNQLACTLKVADRGCNTGLFIVNLASAGILEGLWSEYRRIADNARLSGDGGDQGFLLHYLSGRGDVSATELPASYNVFAWDMPPPANGSTPWWGETHVLHKVWGLHALTRIHLRDWRAVGGASGALAHACALLRGMGASDRARSKREISSSDGVACLRAFKQAQEARLVSIER